MRKAVVEERMLILMGVIVVCLLALYVAYKAMVVPGIEQSNEAQAKVMANVIAISVNSLSGMDAGRVEKDFGFKQPMDVEIYEKDLGIGNMYVKVTYSTNGTNIRTYEVPILVSVNPVPKTKLNFVSLTKDQGGKIRFEGSLINKYPNTPDVGCKELSPQELKTYIDNAAAKFNVDKNLIKAVITQESYGGCMCIGCKDGAYVKSSKGAIGLMQVMPSTAAPIAKSLGYDPEKSLFDPEKNVMIGAKYLSDQIKTFGNMELSVAAYNCGPGCVSSALRLCNMEAPCSTWDKAKYFINAEAARETLPYVDKVMGYYRSCYSSGGTCSTICQRLC